MMMKKRTVWMITVILMMAALCVPAMAQQQTDVYDYEWYLQPAPNEEGKAYVAFWCNDAPVQLQYNPNKDSMPYYWNVTYSYEEINGIPFHVERVTEVFFNEENQVSDVFVSTGEGCRSFCRELVIAPHVVCGTNIVRPACSNTGYGIAVSGTDEKGNELTFGFYVPLSQEIKISYTLEDVTAPQTPEEGKAFLSLTPSENPAPLLIASDAFGGGNGWFYGFAIENTSDISFTPVELVEVYFYEGYNVYQSAYSAETMVNDWGYPAVYEKGATAHFGGGMPQQDVDMVGYLLRGTDANGNELEFTTCVELERK